MIYRTNRISNFKYPRLPRPAWEDVGNNQHFSNTQGFGDNRTLAGGREIPNSQDGVTLLLGILVLSSILAISFSLATVIFVEVRSSSDLLRSETSYYGAQALGEQALYKIKRGINANPANQEQCDNSLWNCYSNSVGIVDTASVRPVESMFTDPVQQVMIPQSSSLPASGFPANAQHFVFYDPSNPHGGSGYGRISLTYLQAGNNDHVQVYLCEFDPTFTVGLSGASNYPTVPCSEPARDDGYWKAGYGGSAGGFDFYSARSPRVIDLIPTKQQELVVFNPQPNTGPVYLQIETFDQTNKPKGIPYLEQTAVDISAQNGTVGRKIRVLVPNSSSGTGSSPGGPAAYWELDEPFGSTSFASSPGGNTGSCSGAACPVAGVAGKAGTAASFDGVNDVISIPDSSAWAFSGDFTLALWVKANSWSGNWWTRAFLGQDDGAGFTNKWIFSYDGSKTIFHINTTSGGGPYLRGNAWVAATGSWYHLAVTRQGNTYTFYRNGSPDGVVTNSTAIPDASVPLTIGWAEGPGSFNGVIDGVRIYNRALSASEISTLAQ